MTGEVIYVVCWLLFAAIAIILEIISLGLTTIWFAGGAIIAALAALAGANLGIQILLFAVISVVLLVLTRPIAVKYLDSKTQKTNAEALVGQQAMVLDEVNNALETGRAKINGMEWTARSKDHARIIPAGTMAKVVEIQGVKLILEPEPATTQTQTLHEEEHLKETAASEQIAQESHKDEPDDIQIV